MPLKIGVDLDINEADAKIKKLEAGWEKANQKVERQKQKIQELNKEIEEHNKLLEYAKKSGQDISKDKWAQELQQRLKENNTELKRLEANATLAGIKLKEALLTKATNIPNILKDANKELKRLETNSALANIKLKDALSPKETNMPNILNNVSNSFRNVLPNSINIFKGALSGISSIFNNLISGITGFISRVSKLATYTFIFNVINASFRDMREYMSYLISANNDLSTSLAQVRGNLLTAFQPIWETILPYLIQFTQWLAKATAYIASFINTLLGKNEQQSRETAKNTQQQIALSNQSSKALNKQKKSTDKLTASEKKRQNVLAKFDELNVIKEHKDKSKTPSAIPAVGAGAGAGGISQPTGVSFDTSNIDTSGIQSLVDKIKNYFLPLQEPFDRLMQSLDRLKEYTFEAFSDFYNLFLQPLSDYVVNEALPHLLNSLADSLDRMDFGTVNDGLRELWQALEPFTEETYELMLWFVDKFLLPIAEWTVNDAIPEFLRTTINLIKILNKSLKILRPLLDDLYNKIIKPLGDYLNDRFHDIMVDINDVLDKINKTLEENGEDIKVIARFIIDTLAVAFTVFKNVFSSVFQTLRDNFSNTVDFISGLVSSLIRIFSNLIQFFQNLFQGKFVEAFGNLGNIFAGVFNIIIIKFEYLVNNVILAINSFLRKISAPLNAINELTGMHLRTLPEIPRVSLPRLASGAVIPPNSPFLAMLGDQKSGTNIEAPLDTIKQAFTEALRENNMNGNGSYTFVAQLDGHTIFEETVRQNDMYINQSGRSAFAY